MAIFPLAAQTADEIVEKSKTVNDRITSYNVCYTKLLREKTLRAKIDMTHPNLVVITSYSIHYTKLYDARRRNVDSNLDHPQ